MSASRPRMFILARQELQLLWDSHLWFGSVLENTDAIIQILNKYQPCLILSRRPWWVCKPARRLKAGSVNSWLHHTCCDAREVYLTFMVACKVFFQQNDTPNTENMVPNLPHNVCSGCETADQPYFTTERSHAKARHFVHSPNNSFSSSLIIYKSWRIMSL